MKAIEDAYHTFMMQHKYPFTSLYLTINGEDVDINVHPTKMEVRFSHQEQVYKNVYQAVLDGLSHRELIPEVTIKEPDLKSEKDTLPNKPRQPIHTPEPFENKRRILEQTQKIPVQETPITKAPIRETPVYHKSAKKDNTPQEKVPVINEDPQKKTEQKPEQMELFDGILLSPDAKKHHNIIGQVFDTYWLVQMEDKLYIIDQHAAHEKVLYERIVKEMKDRKVTSQLLSPPLIISLNLQECDKLNTYMHVFTSLGFEIEVFGGQEYSIRAVPQNLYGLTQEDFFIEILDHLEETPISKAPDVLSDRMATMACKAAVKGNQKLSSQEAIALIDELLTLDNPYNCPHGRPTIISMTKYELEKKFKRIV